MIRVYIIPAITESGWLHPKYLAGVPSGTITGRFECKRFGDDLLRLVFIDISDADHAILSAYPDVVSFPANLNNNIPANQVVNVKTSLAALNMPYKFVSTSITWKQLIKKLINHTETLKNIHKRALRFFDLYTLDTKLVDLPQAVKDKIQAYIDSKGYVLNVTAQTDVEDLLSQLADHIPVIHKIFGGDY